MPISIAERFTDALHGLEDHRDLEPIVALFGENCRVGNVIVPEKFHGLSGAREFWTKYRDTFDTVHSTFRNQIVMPSRIALEWTTEATSSDGGAVHYDGVSILEIEGEKIERFEAYFDPAALERLTARVRTS